MYFIIKFSKEGVSFMLAENLQKVQENIAAALAKRTEKKAVSYTHLK